MYNMAREHPKWSLETLQHQGCASLTRKDELIRFRIDIQNGGTAYEKYYAITKWTIYRFKEAQSRKSHVTTRNLQEWAMQAAMQYISDDFKFTASTSWVNEFKSKFRISQRKVTRFVKPTER